MKKKILIGTILTSILLLDLVNIRSIRIFNSFGINLKNINVEMWSALLIAFIFYIFEVKRENEQLKLREEEESKKYTHEARKFNLDNYNEIDYYPLCQVAEYLDTEFQIKRDIYKKYILCAPQVKKRVLELSNCEKINKLSMELIQEKLELFVNDTNKVKLGECLFYDGFKYLHNAKDYFDDKLPLDKRYIFENPYKPSNSSNLVDIYLPIDHFVEKASNSEELSNIKNPYELLIRICEKDKTSDSDICFFLMELINNTIYSFRKNGILERKKYVNNIDEIEYVKVGSEELKTFEDYYYYTLLNIHNAYKIKVEK